MALIATSLQSLLIGEFAGNGMTGSYDPQLANALSQGITTYILASNQVITQDNGLSGSGQGTSTVIGINPGILTPMMIGQFSSEGLLGTYGIKNLPTAISNAFCNWFNASNQTVTQHVGVGSGVGVGKVIGLEPNGMKSSIIGFMAQNGILGQYHPNVAAATAQAICPHILSAGTVITPITGGGAIPPATGAGIGKVI